MSKYYTPKIEEFYVGFEYEEKSSGLWTTQLYNEYSPIINQYLCDDYGVKIDSIQDYINQEIVRIKYLDQEDIESLGFNHNPKTSIKNVFTLKTTDETYILKFKVHMRKNFNVSIQDDKSFCYFEGLIKNKSELKKVLQLIGVLEDD